MIRISNSLKTSIINAKLTGQDTGQLRERYQKNSNHHELEAAYVLSRMPSTYAAIMYALQRLPDDVRINSVLDIGSGPGTGLWAVKESFPDLAEYTGLEADSNFISLAQKLSTPLRDTMRINWLKGMYPDAIPEQNAQLVLMSYTLNENSVETIQALVQKLWACSDSEWFVIVEPGNIKGFQSLLKARSAFVALGATIVAPCVGNAVCPLKDEDWCHFSVRLERPSFQKSAKQASLGYEDEKLSYLIVRRSNVALDEEVGRVIKKPMKRSGHIVLDTCSNGKYERQTITKSNREQYALAKKVEWGDLFR